MGRNRHGSPEGTRAHRPSNRTRRAGPVIALALFAVLVTVAIGDETARLTVENHTPHGIKVVVGDRTFPGVAAGSRATYEASGADTVVVIVSYLPDQGVEGRAQRTFMLSPYHPPTYGTTVYFACSTTGNIIAPATGGPVVWKVTADTLAGR